MIKFWSALSLRQPFNSSKAKHTWPLFKEIDLDQHKEKDRCVQAVLFLKCTFKIRKWKTYSCAKVLFYNFLLLRSFMLLARISEIKYLAWTIVLVILGLGIQVLLVSESHFEIALPFLRKANVTLLTLLFTITLFKKKKKFLSWTRQTEKSLVQKCFTFLVQWGARGPLLLMKLKHTHC